MANNSLSINNNKASRHATGAQGATWMSQRMKENLTAPRKHIQNYWTYVVELWRLYVRDYWINSKLSLKSDLDWDA